MLRFLNSASRCFGALQPLLQLADLLVEESLCLGRAAAVAADRALGQVVEQRAHDLDALLPVRVPVGDLVDRVADLPCLVSHQRGRGDLDLLLQPGHQAVHLARRGHVRVEVGLARHGLQLRPGQQRLAHQRQLRLVVLLDRDAFQHRSQRRARIDEHLRRGLVPVRQRHDDEPRDQGHDPGRGKCQPAPVPDRTREAIHHREQFVHG